MGFLDHSTNNIIVDAVLTDYGREKLANATSASNFIMTYGFADDEIDYTMVKKYGTVVGKEKIEKNTPVFEASTNAELGVKYYLNTTSNPIVAQPTISTVFSNASITNANTDTSLTITVTDDNQQIDSIEYTVIYDYRFLSPSGNFTIKKQSVNKRFFVVEAANKESIVLAFKQGKEGAKLTKKSHKTSVYVKGSAGTPKDVAISVDYT